MELTDEEIIKKIKTGETKLFSVIVERYEQKMRRYALKFLHKSPDDVDDLVQDVFVKTYTNIHSFDDTKKFSSWLYRIAHNAFLNHIRSAKREMFRMHFDTALPFLYSTDNPETSFELKKLSTDLDASLEHLDQKYREIIVLRFYEGLSYEEIADVLRVPTSTVGVRLSRALKQIKKFVI